jgi:hypothetical protein
VDACILLPFPIPAFLTFSGLDRPGDDPVGWVERLDRFRDKRRRTLRALREGRLMPGGKKKRHRYAAKNSATSFPEGILGNVIAEGSKE